MNRKQSNRDILTELFFRLLPYQILLSVISAVNGIVDSLYASNALGKTAMSAIGLYGPFNHFFYAIGHTLRIICRNMITNLAFCKLIIKPLSF